MPKAKKTPVASTEELRDRFLERARELWDEHEVAFMEIMHHSESKKVRVPFYATLDFSDTAPELVTGISYHVVHRDKRTDTFDDPDQEPIASVADEAKNEKTGARPPRRGRPPKASLQSDVET